LNTFLGTTITQSRQETFELGYRVGQSLEHPAVFLLEGNLGAGKTVLAKGLICGLGQPNPDDVTSPSFTLINEYHLRLKVFHIDLYRLDKVQDLQSLDLEEILGEPAVVVVEWAEKLGKQARAGAICVKMEDLGGDTRRIEIQPCLS
jgi:tRNA threonylcarbamoyladenosine biosynthesis protein TsaE